MAAQELTIYDDALQNAWQDYSFGDPGTVDFANPAPTHTGAASIRLSGSNFNAISFAHETVDYSSMTWPVLRLWVHGGTSGGQQLRLYLQRDGAQVGEAELDSYIPGGALVASEWREVVVPLAQAPLSFMGLFDRIDLQSDVAGTQPALYVDDVTLGQAAAGDPLFDDGFEGGGNPGQLRFTSTGFSAGEAAGNATISVERIGGSSGPVGVGYATSDGTATAPDDYAATSGSLSWGNGDAAPKSFTVGIVDDPTIEGDETVALALSAPTGGATLAAPFNATLTIADDDAPATPPMLIENNVVVGGMTSDRFTWRDTGGEPRVAVLAHNTGQVGPGGTRGGELRELRYETPGGTRIVRASSSGASGFGYVVSHRNEGTTGIGADDSPLGHGFTGSFVRVFEGRHHALFRFTQRYPRYSRTDAAPPNTQYQVLATTQWLFATGRDHPQWSVTWDLADALPVPVPANALNDDSRAPYGELLFDGSASEGAHAVIAGVAWGDRYDFTTTDAAANYNSTWTWNNTNLVPYVKLWTTAVDATMGTVQTQTIVQHDAGGYFGTGRWNTTSASGNACNAPSHRMPCDFNWPYQSINYSLNPFQPNNQTNNTRLAWGTNFGFLGQTSYATHGSAFWGGPLPDTFASGWPRQSYSAYVVLGRHTLDPVGAQVTQVEVAQNTTASATVGSVATSGPAGVNRPVGDDVTYAPVGYDPVYAAWTFSAAGNTLDANLAVAAGTLRKPLLVVRNWTQATAPSQVRMNGVVLAADNGYFASVRSSAQQLWITLDMDVGGPTNRVQVDP